MRSIGAITTIGLLLILAATITLIYVFISLNNASVVIEWTTASELNTAGYNLYRSDQPDGPYAQVNKVLIPIANDPLVGGEYSYVDETVIPGGVYYYVLEDTQTDGNANRNGPIRVEAGAGGKSELVFGFALIFVSLSGIIYLYRRYKWFHTNNVLSE